ncbi:protein YLS3-like [Punica granatum]|uniref:Bifunctional inhibitor/plant lipid transfer protein/seed storage helical domain-containing protein n=2 Tax=Punica granatum TaxID=22663 RepID=A0A218WM22_PUNGR|nr:protein YLS3-like [Punica granatum]OWM73410.1 hypothetical protein CDL15_Pgr026509 [Punica granatum]PKI43158.1 hypothetical protein CRG98_036464 [Punica granatum]
MGSSEITSRSLRAQAILVVVMVALVGFSDSDLAQERAECTEQLVSLAPCLPYVGGDAKAPTPDCCSGLGQVLQKSFRCLCVLVKDRDEPSLGLKINTTLALGLPSSCHAPVNISQCIELLRLNPSSPEAKMFSGYESSLEKGNSTQVPAANGNPSRTQQTGANTTSDGSIKKPVPALKAVLGVAVWKIIGSSKIGLK